MSETSRRANDPGTAHDGAGDPNVLASIAGFEDTLRSLRNLYSEQQLTQTQLQQRQADLAQREEQFLRERQAVEQRRHEAEELSRRLDARQAEVDQARSALSRERAELEGRATQLETLEQQLESTRVEQERLGASLGKKQADVESAAQASSAAADRRAKELQDLRAQIESKREENRSAETELSARQAALEARERSIEKERQLLSELDAKLARQREELEQREQALAAREGELARQGVDAQALQARIRELEQLAEQRRVQVERAMNRAGELGADLGKTLIRAAELEGEVEQLRLQLKQPAPQPTTAPGASTSEVAALEAKVRSLNEVVHEYEQLWTISRGDVRSVAGALQQRAEEIAELESVLAQLRARLKEELASSRDAQSPEPSPQAQQIARQIDDASAQHEEALRAAQLELATLRSKLEEEFAEKQQALRTAEIAVQERDELQQKLERVAAKLQATQEELRRALSDRPSFGPSETSARLERRAARLKLYKALVKDKSEKMRRGGEVLKKRFEACEQLLQQRVELAAVHTALNQTQRRNQRLRATSRVGGGLLCVAASLAIVAALAWVISRETFPGRYAATTELRAEGRGRELNEGELREWQRYHEELVKDPRFADAVSKRMGRKGMAELSTPGAVQQRLAADLSVESAQDGTLRLEYRGVGPERTVRELETIAVTLASEANGARSERVDGGVTTPPSPAKPGDRPIDDTQLMAASAMFGGGALLILIGSIVAWTKLARAKSKFEQDTQLAAILDEARWGDPRQAA